MAFLYHGKTAPAENGVVTLIGYWQTKDEEQARESGSSIGVTLKPPEGSKLIQKLRYAPLRDNIDNPDEGGRR